MNTIKVYQSKEDIYIDMKVVDKYRYIGESDELEFTNGKIYNCVGYEDDMARIVDETNEDYLYSLHNFIKIEEKFKTKSGRPITYCGTEYSKDIKKVNDDININSLDELFKKLLDAWCKETAYPRCQNDYDHDNDPTYGQCAITATIVHDIFGGTIHRIKVDGGTHYFNKINGHYMDLTSDQFELYNIPINYELNEEIPRKYCGRNSNTLKRYNLLVELLNKK